ncbi:hypothetical protein Pan241w_05760 [Gimesia alba]|uniref:Uncharacterized protein n=1 Tax=Gimesia alba TaxID=2527973 RepID=A0A517R9E7_9PLAN|nr:hypothetical protein Pan241w_05760 [Gimesia alba]
MLQFAVDVVNVRIISASFKKNLCLRGFSHSGSQITKTFDFLMNRGMLCCAKLAAFAESRRAIEQFLVQFFHIRMTS